MLLFSAVAAFGQQKPLTQPEFIRLLYSLERDQTQRDAIVDALRTRGIEFVLTDGIRSLARTKGKNDPELRRALEEAERRRQNPAAATPPTKREADELLREARERTLDAVGEMPDFVVKQLIQRSAAFAGTNNFRNRDRLVVAVSYRSSGHEEYRVLSINGALQANPEAKGNYAEVGGTSSTGEFVLVLSTIFKPESETRFDAIGLDTIGGRRAMMFDFSVERDRAKQEIRATGPITESTIAGIRGRLWIDLETKRVLRIESEATDIPQGFPITSAKRTIDYDWAVINEERYLLPSISDVRLTFRDRSNVFETRNLIRFREYQKFGTEVIIRGEDEVLLPDEKP